MDAFYGVLDVVIMIFIVLIGIVLFCLHMRFWIVSSSSQSVGMFGMMFYFIVMVLFSGLGQRYPTLGMICAAISMSQFLIFPKIWEEFRTDCCSKKVVFAVMATYMLLIVASTKIENYQTQYRWDNASVSTVCKIEQEVVQQDDYVVTGTENPAATYMGKVDVIKHYLRLNNGKRYEVKNPEHYQIGDTIHVFDDQIVEKP